MGVRRSYPGSAAYEMADYPGAMESIPPVLALDVGTKTIGIALCERGIVLPVCTLARASVAKDAVRVAQLCHARGVQRVIVGLPYALDGTEGRSARLARQVGEAVRLAGFEVCYQDERYSTVEALTRLGAAEVFRERRRAAVDQVAAVVILEEWLAAQE